MELACQGVAALRDLSDAEFGAGFGQGGDALDQNVQQFVVPVAVYQLMPVFENCRDSARYLLHERLDQVQLAGSLIG